MSSIAIYGAAGHTAGFVRRELERRRFTVVPIGREVDCGDPDALDRALEGVSAVINCAGPFADTAPALVEAALRRKIHYLDISAEQRSVRQTLATYHDEARTTAGIRPGGRARPVSATRRAVSSFRAGGWSRFPARQRRHAGDSPIRSARKR